MGAGVEVEEGEGGACMDRREHIHCPISTGSTVDSPNNSTQNHFKGETNSKSLQGRNIFSFSIYSLYHSKRHLYLEKTAVVHYLTQRTIQHRSYNGK